LVDAVHGPQRGTDEREIRGIGGERGSKLRVYGWGAHPKLERRWTCRGGVEIDRRASFPWDQVERDLMLGTQDGGNVVDGLALWATTPRLWRAVMLTVAKDRPSW
jgi:hypothetical protein